MAHVPSWRRYLRFWRRDVVADVDDEVRFHLEARVEELIALGRAAGAARAQALEEFGDVEQVRAGLAVIDRRIQQTQRRTEWWSSVAQDVRHAARSLRRTPAFSFAAIVTIALGVGVNSVIFSAVDAVLLRPLPYAEPDRLVFLLEGGSYSSRGSSAYTVSPANLVDYRADNHVFTDMAAYELGPMALTSDDAPPQRVWVERVTASFFPVLGQRIARGRNFADEEDTFGNEHVAVISDELWREKGSDPALPGGALRLDGASYRVVGILPPGFQAPNQFGFGAHIALYVPEAFPPELLGPRGHGDHEVNVVARLRPGASIADARTDLERTAVRLRRAWPGESKDLKTFLEPLHESVVGYVRTSLLVLLGAVGLVWLVACVNLANLLLVRAVGRQREVTVRVALGASRYRVVQSLLAHSVLVAMAGCVAGLALGALLRGLLLGFAPADIPRIGEISLNAPVFAVTAALSLAAGVVFGLLPAWQVSRAQPAQALRASEHSSAGRSVLRWQRGLVVAEVALSFILLIGSGLLLRSFVTLMGVDLGFEPDRVLATAITLPPARYPDADARLHFFEALEERVRALPGVTDVGYANRLPLRGGWSTGIVTDRPGVDTVRENVDTDMQAVSPGYFGTLGIALLRGRLFQATDRKGGIPVAVVNASFARRFFPGGNPLGHRFHRGLPAPWITIVGVVADIRRGGKTAELVPEAYLPAAQTDIYPVRLGDLAVRTSGDPEAALPLIRDAVRAVDKDQPVGNAHSLNNVIADAAAPRRFEAVLLLLFAGVALALAVVGIYGVVSYTVSQRTTEFGIRVALGAAGGDIVRMVVTQAGALIALGLVVGWAGAWALSRYLTTLLFEIRPDDPPTFAAVAALLAAVALAACFVPARRAAAVDPMTALRAE